MEGKFIINNKEYNLVYNPKATLLTLLRENGFTDPKDGCSSGECGCCSVLIDGQAINSCQVFAATVSNVKITTAQGIGDIFNPHPLQEAFAKKGGSQCGFCTPAKIVSAYALLKNNPDPSDDEIKEAIGGSLCRCTGYVKIIDSIKDAAERMRANV